ncbi:MAG: pyridoxamine 5'-phosphate oxidase family protein [Actinomycetota bacterium]
MRWDEFERACPPIAELARERFAKDELVIVGTIRPDGSARISPNECDFAAGRLFISMMWRSEKALDLLRDPRAAVHSVPHGRMNPGGDIKLYGRIVEERDSEIREAFRDEIRRRIDWAPDEPNYHCFSFDVTQAGFISFGDNRRVMAWDERRGYREPTHPDA